MNQNKRAKMYMDDAERVAQESYCTRLKVGAVIVTPDEINIKGFNGTLPKFKNKCELQDGSTDPVTVIHAEQNALYKMLRKGISTQNAEIFITHSPCLECSKMIICAGIKKVTYKYSYRCTKGVDLLKKAGVVVMRMEE